MALPVSMGELMRAISPTLGIGAKMARRSSGETWSPSTTMSSPPSMIRPIKSTTLPAISSDACKVAVSTIIETDPLSSASPASASSLKSQSTKAIGGRSATTMPVFPEGNWTILPRESTPLPAPAFAIAFCAASMSRMAPSACAPTTLGFDPISSTLVPGGIRSSSLILTAATDPTEAGPVLKCTISPRAKILVPPFESATAAGVVAEGSVDSADDSVSTATDDMCRRLLSTESVLEGKRARPGAIVPKARAGVLWPTRAL